MSRAFALSLLLASSTALAAAKVAEPEAQPLAGPFATLDAYCQVAPKRTLEESTGWACARPLKPRDDGDAPVLACAEPAFVPLPGGALTGAKMLELRAGERRPLCLLAWHTAAGWYVAEESFQPSTWAENGTTAESRISDKIVAARPMATANGRGLVGRVRERSSRRMRDDKEGDYYLDCTDALLLFGIGPSGALSQLRYDVGSQSRCEDIVEGGENWPPSKWDHYRIDSLLPDGRLRLREAGRHPTKGAPRVADHVLRFP